MLALLSLALLVVPVAVPDTVFAAQNSGTETKALSLNGWVTRGGHRYYYRNGKPLKGGWHTIKGKRHYFNRYGQAVKGWLKYKGKRYYLNSYGQIYTGSKKIGKYRYYFHTKYGHAYVGWNTIRGKKYYYDSLGRAATGTRTIGGRRYTFNSYGLLLRVSNPVVYRALAIGESDYMYANDLYACRYDAYGMSRMLKKTGYSTVRTGIDVSGASMYSMINNTFAKADSNDVSLFYYSGHGADDGSLVSVDHQFISPSRLASWLKQIPGRVVVVLDSCYSGAVIGKSEGAGPESFNEKMIQAFNEVELETCKGGSMSNSKFKVLTACSKNEYSWTMGYFSSKFTYYLVNGVGYDYNGSRKSRALADTNKNKKLTLQECYKYTRKNCLSGSSRTRQYVQCYPSNSDFKLFQR